MRSSTGRRSKPIEHRSPCTYAWSAPRPPGPDLVRAGVLVTVLAGNARQLTAALLDVVLASANGGFFVVADMLPATAPLGVAAAATFLFERSAAEDVSALPGFSARRSSGFLRAISALPTHGGMIPRVHRLLRLCIDWIEPSPPNRFSLGVSGAAR